MKKNEEKNFVSHETLSDLKCYLSLLEEWQEKFNLVSRQSLTDAWNRHFLDSIQLFKYVPKSAENLIDFGSGAGFPGMVLAIMGKNRTPYLKVTLVESIRKKTVYLKEVSDKTNTRVEILNERIENLKNKKFDVITSRAMTALTNLLNYALPFCKKETVCIFPKGKKYEEEIEEAKKQWSFDCKIEANEVSEEGKILIVTNITRRKK